MDIYIVLKSSLIAVGTIIFFILIHFSYTFLMENEKRPSVITLLSAVIISTLFIIPALIFESIIVHIILLSGTFLTLIFFIIPVKHRNNKGKENVDLKLDERDIMFSRAELIPGTERFDEYYKSHPQNKVLDDKFRSKSGLLSKDSQKYHPLRFSCADANFEAVDAFKYLRTSENDFKKEKINTDSKELSEYIKKWLKQIGALSVGITELKEHHIYKVTGRGDEYGKEISLKHKFAIALTVEMDKNMIDQAPDAETVMESSQQYFRSAALAAQLTHFIRNLGYSAKPHFDGNYDVLCPTVARDAGLGELGRMGLLMSHEIGPRVRIAVVTTNIPLASDERNYTGSMLEFCKICKKCADNCPSNAISFDDMKEENGLKRWTINHEACFTYWTITGTDCAKCIQVCPYAHPENFMHNLIRKGIHNSRYVARAALAADDLFYGRKPNKKKKKK